MPARFTFRLDTLLRVRALRERECERAVAQVRAEIARLDAWCVSTQDEIEARQNDIRSASAEGAIDPRELARLRAWIAHLRGSLSARSAERSALLAQSEARLAEWRDARRDRRVIEKMRETRLAQHLRDVAAGDQAQADELAQQLHAMRSDRADRDRSAAP
ncbi:MAG: flagellar FliJ family protein [Phycisphaerales bacterium]|nr:flagellar FliJ family protein [Phycisphaerales bacterium]